MAIISADKDTPYTKLILQICKYDKKAFFPLAISANWLEHPLISKGSLSVSSDKEISDFAGGIYQKVTRLTPALLHWLCHITQRKSKVNIYFGLYMALVEQIWWTGWCHFSFSDLSLGLKVRVR